MFASLVLVLTIIVGAQISPPATGTPAAHLVVQPMDGSGGPPGHP